MKIFEKTVDKIKNQDIKGKAFYVVRTTQLVPRTPGICIST